MVMPTGGSVVRIVDRLDGSNFLTLHEPGARLAHTQVAILEICAFAATAKTVVCEVVHGHRRTAIGAGSRDLNRHGYEGSCDKRPRVDAVPTAGTLSATVYSGGRNIKGSPRGPGQSCHHLTALARTVADRSDWLSVVTHVTTDRHSASPHEAQKSLGRFHCQS